MTALRCPVCKAENTTPSQCRRCKADLSLLWRLEEQRQRDLVAATAAVIRQDCGRALELLDAADAARRGTDAARLRALCQLLRRDFAAALASSRRARGERSADA